jgi:hypothetical protein
MKPATAVTAARFAATATTARFAAAAARAAAATARRLTVVTLSCTRGGGLGVVVTGSSVAAARARSADPGVRTWLGLRLG